MTQKKGAKRTCYRRCSVLKSFFYLSMIGQLHATFSLFTLIMPLISPGDYSTKGKKRKEMFIQYKYISCCLFSAGEDATIHVSSIYNSMSACSIC